MRYQNVDISKIACSSKNVANPKQNATISKLDVAISNKNAAILFLNKMWPTISLKTDVDNSADEGPPNSC